MAWLPSWRKSETFRRQAVEIRAPEYRKNFRMARSRVASVRHRRLAGLGNQYGSDGRRHLALL